MNTKKAKTRIKICAICGKKKKCYLKGYCRECNNRNNREYRRNNPDKARQMSMNWVRANAAKVREYQRDKQKKYRAKSSLRKLKHTVRVYLRCFLNNYMNNPEYNPRSKYMKMLGCDIAKYVGHLLYSYSGKVKLEELQIDHIIPLSSAKSRVEVIRLCHYTNLRLIAPEENRTGRPVKYVKEVK